MKKLPKVTMYSFTCLACKNTLTVTKPFEMHYCPFCRFILKVMKIIRSEVISYDGYDLYDIK